MKLFRFYSTAENVSNPDTILDISQDKFRAIKLHYDSKHEVFVVNLDTDKADMRELHQDINFAKERAKLILMQFDVPEDQASQLLQEARFLIK